MSTAGRIRRVLRWLVLGRRDGVRAGLRRTFGVCTSVDRAAERAPAETSAPVEPVVDELEGWTSLVPLSELDDGDVLEVMAGERALALARVGDEVHALDNVCPHAGGPLGDGELDGCELTCPWHGWTFDVRDGSCTMDPTLQAETVEVKVHQGHIYVRA